MKVLPASFFIKHKKIFFAFLALILSVFVIYQGSYYRWLGYERIPGPTIDEFTYVWGAESLKAHGLPVGWTLYSGVFKDAKFNAIETRVDGFGIKKDGRILEVSEFRKNPRPLIAVEEIDWGEGKKQLFFASPFVDHPPLGGLVFSLGVDKAVQTFDGVKLGMVRQPALVIGVLNCFLILILVYLLTKNLWISLFAIAVYSTVPTYLFSSKTAFLENAAPPFILGHLIFLIKGLDIKRPKLSMIFLFLSGFLGGLGILVKEPVLGFVLGSAAVFYINKISIKRFSIFALGVMLPVVIYISWGLWLQSTVFLSIFSANSNRSFYGSLKFISMLEALRFKNFPVDGWWIWGFVSLFALPFRMDKRILFLILPLLGHLLLILFLGSSNYSWYYLSAIPFLAICGGIFIWQIFRNPDWLSTLAFFLIPLSSSFYWGYSVFKTQSLSEYRLIFLAFFAVLFLRLTRPKSRVVKIGWNIFFIILLILIFRWNIKSIQFMISNWGKLPIPSLPNL